MAKAKTEAPAAPKCPISRGDFATHAKPLTLQGDGMTVVLTPRNFSTGGMGWSATDKTVVMVDGKPVRCQVTFNLSVIGSKELPAAPAAA